MPKEFDSPIPEDDGGRDLSGLVRSWQNPSEVHAFGCPSTRYYASVCTESCIAIIALTGPFTAEEIASLPVSGYENRSSSLETYG